YDDPRDEVPKDLHDVLTEDSDDAFADLEKEFAVKKQKLMEERARKRERNRTALQVERSPSPKRFKEESKPKTVNYTVTLSSATRPLEPDIPKPLVAPLRAFQKVPSVSSNQFATRLFENENQSSSINYNERFYEFENIPKGKLVVLNDQNAKDEISGEILRRRLIQEGDAQRLLKDTKVLRVSKLLAKIVPPKYEEPMYTNWCLTGIVIYKSDPKTTVNGKKYMTLRVGNFSITVDLFLFGDAFQKYWKLRCGDVIAVLNPTVKKYGSGFNLSLQDGLDCILEIGALKNYGHCSGTNKEGGTCKFVIDLLKNDLCSFHEESKFKRGSRMELQGSVKPKAPKNKQGQTSQAFMSGSTNKPLYVQYLNAGFLEKDAVYNGGEQFDQSKYDRPVKENDAAKLRKRKANEKLRLQLLNSAPPNRLNDLEKMGIIPQGEQEKIERQNSLLKIKLQAFKNKFLKGMGYDPTFEKSHQLDKIKPTKSMEELLSISKSKKVSLQPSEEEKRKK
ncbi:hypothetical protein METBIDRAFT_16866, partial [Metschnikowia bicuspidata var. bicuspidata NRRL YB-4993]